MPLESYLSCSFLFIPSRYTSNPNPFNPSTKIKFEINSNSLVKLIIYDLNGRQVAVLADRKLQKGIYELDFNPNEFQLASGIYFYKLATNNLSNIKKMIYLK